MPRTGSQRTESGRPRLTAVGHGAPELGAAVPLGPPSPLPAGAHNLPPGLPPFVGRQRQLAQVIRSLESERLVTLTGPTGIGKTRLALEVAGRTHGAYPNGVWLVELAPLGEPDRVPQAVASALGLDPEPGRDTIEALVARLRTASSLVVLDNAEHVLDACGALVDRLLAECPSVRVLASSQRPLAVPGERRVAVPPLSLLDPALPASVEEALESEAVALFCVRAAAAHAGFTPTDEMLPYVAEICDRLDGIPLAIELAGARVSALGPADIAERLAGRFGVLTGGPPTADARHQSLQAALDWSYELLTPEEATLFRRLSVFAGGATLHAVEEVCTGMGAPRDDAVDLLTSLISKSLVMADVTRARARYRLLETVRAYACDRLEAEGEAAAVRARHAAWAVSLVERAWHQVGPDDQRFWTDALEADHDNIRAALEWAFAHQPPVALRLAAALTPFWTTRGYLQEGQEWLRRAIEISGARRGLRARALYGFALLATMRGEVAVARPVAEESLALVRDGQLRRAEIPALNLLGLISIFTQDPLAAKPVLEESMAKARAEGDPESLIESLALFGRVHLFLGDIDAARRVFEECVALTDPGRDKGTDALIGMGWTALAAGQLHRAQELFERALELLRQAGDRFETALVLSFLGELAWTRGSLAEATALLDEGRALALAMGAPFPLSRCLYASAKVASGQDDAATAEKLAHEAHEVADRARLPYALARALHVRGDLRRASGDPEGARALYQEALTVARANADAVGCAASLYRLARLSRSSGADDEAVALVTEAIKVHADTGDGGLASSLELLGALTAEQGRTVSAAGLFGAAQGLRDALGSVRPPDEIADHDADVAALQAALEPDELEAAWAQGAAMSRQEALALALRGRGSRERASHGWSSLSPTERQIVDLVADGLTNREVGEKLFISPRTVQGYLSRVFAKLDVTSRRQLRDVRRQR